MTQSTNLTNEVQAVLRDMNGTLSVQDITEEIFRRRTAKLPKRERMGARTRKQKDSLWPDTRDVHDALIALGYELMVQPIGG